MRKFTYDYCYHINQKLNKFDQLLSRVNIKDKNHNGFKSQQKQNMTESSYMKRVINKQIDRVDKENIRKGMRDSRQNQNIGGRKYPINQQPQNRILLLNKQHKENSRLSYKQPLITNYQSSPQPLFDKSIFINSQSHVIDQQSQHKMKRQKSLFHNTDGSYYYIDSGSSLNNIDKALSFNKNNNGSLLNKNAVLSIDNSDRMQESKVHQRIYSLYTTNTNHQEPKNRKIFLNDHSTKVALRNGNNNFCLQDKIKSQYSSNRQNLQNIRKSSVYQPYLQNNSQAKQILNKKNYQTEILIQMERKYREQLKMRQNAVSKQKQRSINQLDCKINTIMCKYNNNNKNKSDQQTTIFNKQNNILTKDCSINQVQINNRQNYNKIRNEIIYYKNKKDKKKSSGYIKIQEDIDQQQKSQFQINNKIQQNQKQQTQFSPYSSDQDHHQKRNYQYRNNLSQTINLRSNSFYHQSTNQQKYKQNKELNVFDRIELKDNKDNKHKVQESNNKQNNCIIDKAFKQRQKQQDKQEWIIKNIGSIKIKSVSQGIYLDKERESRQQIRSLQRSLLVQKSIQELNERVNQYERKKMLLNIGLKPCELNKLNNKVSHRDDKELDYVIEEDYQQKQQTKDIVLKSLNHSQNIQLHYSLNVNRLNYSIQNNNKITQTSIRKDMAHQKKYIDNQTFKKPQNQQQPKINQITIKTTGKLKKQHIIQPQFQTKYYSIHQSLYPTSNQNLTKQLNQQFSIVQKQKYTQQNQLSAQQSILDKNYKSQYISKTYKTQLPLRNKRSTYKYLYERHQQQQTKLIDFPLQLSINLINKQKYQNQQKQKYQNQQKSKQTNKQKQNYKDQQKSKQTNKQKSTQKKLNKSALAIKKPKNTKNALQKLIINFIKQIQLDRIFAKYKQWFNYHQKQKDKWSQLKRTFIEFIKKKQSQFNIKSQLSQYSKDKNHQNQLLFDQLMIKTLNQDLNDFQQLFQIQPKQCDIIFDKQCDNIFDKQCDNILNKQSSVQFIENKIQKQTNQQNLKQMIDAFQNSLTYYMKNLLHQFNSQQLIRSGFLSHNFNQQIKGYIQIQDLVNFINNSIGSTYKKTDFKLTWHRLIQSSQNNDHSSKKSENITYQQLLKTLSINN